METWKDILRYEGLYQVSSLGRVRSNYSNGRKKSMDGILKQRDNCYGYLNVHLYKNSKRKAFLVHRIVAESFIPNPEVKNQVNHKNGNKTDNQVENLEWVDQSENQKHKCYVLNKLPEICKGLSGEKNGRAKIQNRISEIMELRSAGMTQESIAKKFNVNRTTIQRAITKQRQDEERKI